MLPLPSLLKREGKTIWRGLLSKGDWMLMAMGRADVEVKYVWAEFGNVDARFMSAYKRFRMGNTKTHDHGDVVLSEPGDDETHSRKGRHRMLWDRV